MLDIDGNVQRVESAKKNAFELSRDPWMGCLQPIHSLAILLPRKARTTNARM